MARLRRVWEFLKRSERPEAGCLGELSRPFKNVHTLMYVVHDMHVLMYVQVHTRMCIYIYIHTSQRWGVRVCLLGKVTCRKLGRNWMHRDV